MSTLRTNALEGVDAKNSITIVAGTGNITTTNVQSGLAKSWINFNGESTIAVRDSFNNSSIGDNGTGNYTVTRTSTMSDTNYTHGGMAGASTNNMSNTNYVVTLCYQPINNNNGTDHFNVFAGQTTSENESRHYENGSTYDLDNQVSMRHGDLA